jgi:hypothetical protein
MSSGDEDATDHVLRSVRFAGAGEHRHVGDHHARLAQEAELERELGRMGDSRADRTPPEELGEDHRDEVRFPARERPEILDHGVGTAVFG